MDKKIGQPINKDANGAKWPEGSAKPDLQDDHGEESGNERAVTGKKTFGKWMTNNWDAFKTPELSGYTPALDEVVKKLVTGDMKDETVDINYEKNLAPKAPEKPDKAETQKTRLHWRQALVQ